MTKCRLEGEARQHGKQLAQASSAMRAMETKLAAQVISMHVVEISPGSAAIAEIFDSHLQSTVAYCLRVIE